MQRYLSALIPVSAAILLAACSSSGLSSTFALVGAPAQDSFTSSANFLISGKTCNYYTYRGDGTNPPEVGEGCTVMEDRANSLGHSHALVKIGFATAKGEQVLTLTQAGNNALAATNIPDIGMYLPENWKVAAPATDMILNSAVAGSVYSGLAIHIDGVRCALTITPVSDNTPVSMPCGLMFWSGSVVSIAIPGSLISSAWTGHPWNLNFSRDSSKAGAWNLAKPPTGFPASYTEAAPAK
ncbi:MAG: hypothetical protein ACRETQ_11260 [Gammaproteobacteria bacterium]